MKTLDVFNSVYKGVYEVHVVYVKDGAGYNYQLVLNKTGNDKNLTRQQKEYIAQLKNVLNGESISRQEIVDSDPNTTVGNWETNRIDITDVLAFGVITGPTAYSVSSHEFSEQYEKAKLGLLPGEIGTTPASRTCGQQTINYTKEYFDSHDTGIDTENKVSGTVRDDCTGEFIDNKGGVIKIQFNANPSNPGSFSVTKTKIR